jgi:hypothetical protein
VQIPETADVGESFDVVVWAYDGGCWGKGASRLAVEGLQATVSPYRVRLDSPSCADIQRFDEYRSPITFGQPGVATVTVRGVSDRRGSEEVIEVDFEVVVVQP